MFVVENMLQVLKRLFLGKQNYVVLWKALHFMVNVEILYKLCRFRQLYASEIYRVLRTVVVLSQGL